MEGGAIVYIALFFSFVIGVIFGVVGAFLSRRVFFNRQIRIAERKAVKMVSEARTEAKNVLEEAQNESKRIKTAADNDFRERRAEVQRQENRLNQKSETLDRKTESVEQRERNLN